MWGGGATKREGLGSEVLPLRKGGGGGGKSLSHVFFKNISLINATVTETLNLISYLS